MPNFDELKKVIKLNDTDIMTYRDDFYMQTDPMSGNNNRDLWNAWFEYFFRGTVNIKDRITEHYDSFWEWFVILTWQDTGCWTVEQMEIILPYQLSTLPQVVPGFLDRVIIMYKDRFDTDKKRVSFHNNVKDKLDHIDYNLTFNDNSTILLGDVRKKVEMILNGLLRNKVDVAEFRDRVQKSLFIPNKGYKFPASDYDSLSYDFVDLIKIFSSKMDVNKLVIEYFRVNTHKNGNEVDVEYLSKIITDKYKNELEKTLEKTGMIIHDKEKETAIKQKKLKVNYSKIVSDLKNEYSFDENDQTADFGAVLSRLEQLSKTLNDPAVAELYYYDEGSGQFKWNK